MENKNIKEMAKACVTATACEKVKKTLRPQFLSAGVGVYRFSENKKTYVVSVQQNSGRTAQNKQAWEKILTDNPEIKRLWDSTFYRADGNVNVTGAIMEN